ncbi:MAG: MFS transporter [Lachnospiraceae bacterium]
MKEKKINSKNIASKREKLCYGLGDVGCNFIWSFAAAFISLYYTDSVGVSVAFVGTLMLVSRIFDGLSDIGMGIIIDKTNTRFGKARPWILFMCIPFSLSLILVFNVPGNLSEIGKNIYIYATYFFMAVICYTATNLAYHAMLPRITTNPKDRTTVTVVRSMMVLVAIMFINSVTNPLLTAFGGHSSQTAWSKVVLLYAGIAFVCLVATFLGVKEKVEPALELEKKNADNGDQFSTKVGLQTVLTCKYFYLAAFVFFLQYFSQGVTNGIGIYFFRDVIGNANLLGLISIIGIIPMVLLMPFMPKLFVKYGKRNTIIVGLSMVIVSSVLQYLVLLPETINLALYFGSILIKSVGGVPLTAAIFTLASDVVDYNVWKKGVRVEGITTSINSFGMKVGTGLGAAAMGWILQLGKYDGKLEQQLPSAINAMKFISVGMPMIVGILIIVTLIFWDIEKYQKEITQSVEETAKN